MNKHSPGHDRRVHHLMARLGLAASFVSFAIGGPLPWAHAAEAKPPIVVALLVDGLSGQMVERFDTPNLDRLRAEGSWSHALQPTFPAISGPTWVSLSTGCWPAHHGIVTDKFLDPDLGLMDHSSNPEWLQDCELLQQVAERQGVKTAALGWWGQWSRSAGSTATFVSSNAEVEQRIPRNPQKYLSDRDRANEIIGYLHMPAEQRPQLILGYFRGPDHDAHFEGLFSPENGAAVRSFDAAVGTILGAIAELEDKEAVSVLVFSDHGMVPVQKIVNLPRIMRRLDIDARAVTTGTTGFLYFGTQSAIEPAYQGLSEYDEFDVFTKEALPAYMNMGTGPRVPDLIIAAKPGYYTADPDLWPWYLRPFGFVGSDFVSTPLLGAGLRAAHGYGPGTPGNDGVFYAWGHGISQAVSLGSVRMIDVHPTIASLLSIEPGTPVDGTAIEQVLER